MLQNTVEQTSLTVPSDAVELSLDELEDVNGAGGWGSSCGGWSCGSCATFLSAVDFSAAVHFSAVTFASFFSCGNCWGGGWSCGSCWGNGWN